MEQSILSAMFECPVSQPEIFTFSYCAWLWDWFIGITLQTAFSTLSHQSNLFANSTEPREITKNHSFSQILAKCIGHKMHLAMA